MVVRFVGGIVDHHRLNFLFIYDLGIWYDNRSMYLVVHKGLKICFFGYILRDLNTWGLLKYREKINETSQE